MNLMQYILSDDIPSDCNKSIKNKILMLKEKVKKEKIKFQDKSVKLKDTHYFYNGLPNITKDRDVLLKPDGVCKIRVNWKKKSFEGLSSSEILNVLKEQWAWTVTTVDTEHTRNKFKNKDNFWVVFDTQEDALRNMNVFNELFMTAIEQDTVEEYKKFKENPIKRPLTFDKLVANAYELYEAVDNGEL